MQELDKAFGKALGKFFAFLVGGLIVLWERVRRGKTRGEAAGAGPRVNGGGLCLHVYSPESAPGLAGTQRFLSVAPVARNACKTKRST